MADRFCPHLTSWIPGAAKAFGGLAVLVLEGRFGTSSGHFNGRLPGKIAAVGQSLHSPSRACSYTHLLSSYNSHTLQLFNVETPVQDMTGHLGTWYQLAKMARVTPRLGNGPRFGTCSVLFHSIRQIFSLPLSCQYVCMFL